MIFKTTKLIAATFKEKDIIYDVVENNKYSSVDCGFSTKHGRRILIRFMTNREMTNNQNSVAIRVFNFADVVPSGKITAAAVECMTLNSFYNYVSFSVNNNNEVFGASWLPTLVSDELVGMCCYEMLWHVIGVVEAAIPRFGQIVYGESKKEDQPAEG